MHAAARPLNSPVAAPPRARVWSETVPLADVGSPRVAALLRRFGVAVDVAVRPWDLRSVAELAARCEGEGVVLGVWPMLDDRAGRWASVYNAHDFRDLALRTLDACAPSWTRAPAFAARRPPRLAVDLEPSFVAMERALARFVAPRARRAGEPGRGRSPRSSLRPGRFDAGRDAIRDLVAEARRRGVEPAAAALPPAIFGAAWERVLGTPIRGVDFEAVSAMAYTSIVEGWSRGLVTRGRALRLLAWTSARAVRLLGARAAVSLGAVGVGAFGDEPTYRNPRELAEDARVARRAGVREISLLDLGGVLARAPSEAWLAALTEG